MLTKDVLNAIKLFHIYGSVQTNRLTTYCLSADLVIRCLLAINYELFEKWLKPFFRWFRKLYFGCKTCNSMNGSRYFESVRFFFRKKLSRKSKIANQFICEKSVGCMKRDFKSHSFFNLECFVIEKRKY